MFITSPSILKSFFSTSYPAHNYIEVALRYVSPIISDEVNASLIAIPTAQEIRDTVMIFQDNWEIVQTEVISHVQNSSKIDFFLNKLTSLLFP